jgi:hypothetical protein
MILKNKLIKNNTVITINKASLKKYISQQAEKKRK